MHFEVMSPTAALRILCGLFLVAHILAKIFTRHVTLAFFQAAGYRPAKGFMYFALVVESVASVGLVLGIFLPYIAWIAAIFMLMAVISVLKVSKGRWLWNLGGCEYLIFWTCACVIVALSP